MNVEKKEYKESITSRRNKETKQFKIYNEKTLKPLTYKGKHNIELFGIFEDATYSSSYDAQKRCAFLNGMTKLFNDQDALIQQQQARIEEVTTENHQLKDRLGALPNEDEISILIGHKAVGGRPSKTGKKELYRHIVVTSELAKAISNRINGEGECQDEKRKV